MRVPCHSSRAWVLVAIGSLAGLATGIAGQSLPTEQIRIVTPVVDQKAGTVTVPAAFWDPHAAAWLDVAFCGRPSDFLHETVVSCTTTRTELEKALRQIGCRDGDAWADSVKGFRTIRGDRLLITVEFSADGKKQVYSLDELLTLQTQDLSWGGALGPYGFMFKGDPEHSGSAATAPATEAAGDEKLDDAARILRDDPQIALNFKGIQSQSQSFADHPLAYDEWQSPVTLRCGRNYAAVPEKVFNSNGQVAVALTFKRVSEEELIREDAKLWHEDGYRKYMLLQIPTAQQLDRDKAEYLAVRGEIGKSAAGAAAKELVSRRTLLAAKIAAGYAALDRDWAVWAVDHGTFDDKDAKTVMQVKAQAASWKQHMTLAAERESELAAAEDAAAQEQALESQPLDGAGKAKLTLLRGKEIEARARAILADNKQDQERWQAEQLRLNSGTDPRDTWVKEVALHVEMAAARNQAGAAGIAYGEALQAIGNVAPPAGGQEVANPLAASMEKNYAQATLRVSLAEARLNLLSTDFEISKRKDMPDDADLPALRKQHDELTRKISDLQAAQARP